MRSSDPKAIRPTLLRCYRTTEVLTVDDSQLEAVRFDPNSVWLHGVRCLAYQTIVHIAVRCLAVDFLREKRLKVDSRGL